MIIMFLIGAFLFPVGIALGFLNHEHNRKRSLAAFFGVTLVLVLGLTYLIVNWHDIMHEVRMRGWV